MKPNGTINVSVSNHYSEPSYASEVTSQGLLGEQVEIIEHGPVFSRIRQSDDYTSWISSDQVHQALQQDGRKATVTSHFLRIFTEPDNHSEPIRDAVIGSRLRVIDSRDGWYCIALPDGSSGWAQKDHFGDFPGYSPENILKLARTFLGYQYIWGGRSPKGFDCSGFVQTVFGLHGVMLPRDAWQQQQQHILSSDFRDAMPADLLFFAKTPDRVTHVAIALGNGRFIHASGWVKNNSLNEIHKDFSRPHLETFVSVNRYPVSEG